jgi:hypothetical protein
MAKQFLSSPPALLTLLGAIIAAIGVFWASVKNAASQREIIRLNHQLTDKSDEIAKVNARIADLVTGGKAFAYAELTAVLGRVTVVNETDYPLYNLSIQIADLAKMQQFMPKNGGWTFEDLDKWETSIYVGTLGPHQTTVLGKFDNTCRRRGTPLQHCPNCTQWRGV